MSFFPQATPKSHDSDSPRRRGSPRHTGRGSPGARISWLTAARSGVGGQVMLNDKGKGGDGTENCHRSFLLLAGSGRCIVSRTGRGWGERE